MVHVRTRTFCCCLPVRFGVFVLSLSGLLGGATFAVFGWVQVSRLRQQPLSFSDEFALYLLASMFTILAVVSGMGFIGSFIKHRGMVAAFANALAVHLFFSIASGIFTLIALFRQDSQALVDQCVDNLTEDETRDDCKKGVAILKGVIIAVYVIVWLVQLYAFFIVDRYADQLEEEESLKDTERMISQISRPAPVTTYGSPRQPGYTFSDPAQALGTKHRRDPSNGV